MADTPEEQTKIHDPQRFDVAMRQLHKLLTQPMDHPGTPDEIWEAIGEASIAYFGKYGPDRQSATTPATPASSPEVVPSAAHGPGDFNGIAGAPPKPMVELCAKRPDVRRVLVGGGVFIAAAACLIFWIRVGAEVKPELTLQVHATPTADGCRVEEIAQVSNTRSANFTLIGGRGYSFYAGPGTPGGSPMLLADDMQQSIDRASELSVLSQGESKVFRRSLLLTRPRNLPPDAQAVVAFEAAADNNFDLRRRSCLSEDGALGVCALNHDPRQYGSCAESTCRAVTLTTDGKGNQKEGVVEQEATIRLSDCKIL